MNAKFCKRLRKTARDVSVGMPKRWIIFADNDFKSIQNLNDPKSTRGIYRQLKKTFSKKPSQQATSMKGA